jgi:outer membrane protein assembly factor BamB
MVSRTALARVAAIAGVGFLVATASVRLRAEDWPEFRGKGRLGVWNETGILEGFPAAGLTPAWRTPINGGYAGPSVASGRVFVTDAKHVKGTVFLERVVALDEKTGSILWTSDRESNYAAMVATWAIGPVATPTVDGDRVYAVLRMGNLLALDVKDGRMLWQKDFVKDFNAEVPLYGFTGSALVDGDRVICITGGAGNAKVIAFNKMTGEEIWRSLESKGEHGYNSPFLLHAGGVPQLIIWHPTAINSLDPATGKVYWEIPFRVELNLTVATPVYRPPYLFITTHYSGIRTLLMDEAKPAATLLWQTSFGEDQINPWSGTPVIDGDHVYGLNSMGVMRALELKTGKRLWESQQATKEHAQWSSAYITRNGDRMFIKNDRGELIIAKLSPKGYEEISRTSLIKPTHPQPRRRELEFVNWTEPAYANKHIFLRNDQEIVSYSLARQ